MPKDPDETQLANVERLLIEFLNADLDLSFTWLRTAEIDTSDDPPGAKLALSKATQALKGIRRLEGNISSFDFREQIHSRADLLEAAIKTFEN
jgi:hypothetical protein